MSPPLIDLVQPEDDNSRWGWLGLGLGAAALSLVAVWVLVGKPVDQTDDRELDEIV
jgi:hypothetical protein